MSNLTLTNEEMMEGIRWAISHGTKQPQRLNAGLALEPCACDVEGDDPWVEFRYTRKEAHLNPYGGVHGGIISALIDTCSGIGMVGLTHRYVTTTELQVSFLRALNQENYRIRVNFTHVGRTLLRSMVRITEEESGKLMATGMTSFMILPNQPPGLRD